MKRISLLHPFSAQAIGLEEEDLYHSHSKSQELALQNIQSNKSEFKISIDYFTGKLFPYQKSIHNLTKKFWPVTRPLVNKRHQWRKQESLWHYKHQQQQQQPAEVTIINMSGHGSAYCFKLAQLIIQQGLSYIPMVGGVHMSTHQKAQNYYKNAHHILVHTQVQKESLMAQEAFRDLDIRVLPLGVNQNLFQPLDRQSGESSIVKLLQVGRISRLKQVEHSIQLVRFLKEQEIDVELSIIGFLSDEAYYKELLSLISRLEVNQEVNFVGSVEQEEMVHYYQHADLLLMPSQHESFGMVMVEAMACGCPVVGYKGAGGTDEIIQHDFNGLLVTPETIQTSVLNLMFDKTQLNQLRNNALEDVHKNWSLEVTTKILNQSIEDGLRG